MGNQGLDEQENVFSNITDSLAEIPKSNCDIDALKEEGLSRKYIEIIIDKIESGEAILEEHDLIEV